MVIYAGQMLTEDGKQVIEKLAATYPEISFVGR